MESILTIIGTVIATLAGLIAIYAFFEDRIDDLLLWLRGGIPKGFIIFITGTNGVGKSTIAELLGKKLGIISVIEVDDLREVLRSRKDLFDNAKMGEEYKQLEVPSFLADSIQLSENSGGTGSYRRQCEIMTPSILDVACRKQKRQASTIIEGINIMPTELTKHDLNADYVLFVNLKVEPNDRLTKRLKMRPVDLQTSARYNRFFHKILETAKIIDDDFQAMDSHSSSQKIFTLTLFNNESKRKTIKRIVSEVRMIAQKAK